MHTKDEKDLKELGLTARERDVLVRQGDGLTYKEIASNLGISVGTVKKHVSSSIRKLSAKNSVHCIKVFYELGGFRDSDTF